jgi:hypothetical protein
VVDVAADGAAGQCLLSLSRLTCPATDPVTFRWGPGGDWALHGDTVLAPGGSGVAFVLDPVSKAALDGATAEAEHAADPIVRREAIEALQAWTWRSAGGPLPSTAPVPLPDGWLLARSDDGDWRVRRAVVDLATWMRDERRAAEVEATLQKLADDRNPKVKKAAIASLSRAARADMVNAIDAWEVAMEGVHEPNARGRAAAGSLARLSTELTAEEVDPVAAVEVLLHEKPEQAWRVWAAWRDDVPFRDDWVLLLFRETNGLHRGLVRTWAERNPKELAAAVTAWEPSAPHSERYDVLAAWLSDTDDPALRAALGLP